MRPLDRDQWRAFCLSRDHDACVSCGAPATAVHHLLERRLFGPDDPNPGGYHPDNGASLCDPCHLAAEATDLTPEELRTLTGARTVVLPAHLDPDLRWTKWGDQVFPDGTRAKGELFYEDGTQKILAPLLGLYRDRAKHPRTPHLPWSQGRSSDDLEANLGALLDGREIVVTEKMDGECTTGTRDGIWARSVDSGDHPSRHPVKNLWAGLAHDIPEGWRVVGENVYAQHSVTYDDLPGWWLIFSVFDNTGLCLSWDDTAMWADLLGLPTVPVLWRGPGDEKTLRDLVGSIDTTRVEGYVVRDAEGFPISQWRFRVAKWVRKGHVQTEDHWMHGAVTPNRLADR